MSTQNLLVELFVEELPPKALKKLGEAFAGTLFEQLKSQGLTADDSVVTPYASPRRLAAHITHVAAKVADKAVQQKLMPVSVALDAQGQPTPALLKKLVDVNARLTPIQVSADGLRELGIEPAGRDKRAVLYSESQFAAICDAIARRAMEAKRAALLPA